MRYALCFKGISYMPDYTHHGTSRPYNINFMDSIPYVYKNIITPLERAGHTVDIFFVTYETEKLKEFVNLLEPKEVKIMTFNPNIGMYDWKFIFQVMIDGLKLVKDYEDKHGFTYDFTILSRFDVLFVENILDVYLEPNGLSLTLPRCDYVFIIGKGKNQVIIDYFTHMQTETSLMSHDVGQYAAKRGIVAHSMYQGPASAESYPFVRVCRWHFSPGNKDFFCPAKDIYDKDKPNYVFTHRPVKSFNPCS